MVLIIYYKFLFIYIKSDKANKILNLIKKLNYIDTSKKSFISIKKILH